MPNCEFEFRDVRVLRAQWCNEEEPTKTEILATVVENLPPIEEYDLDVRDYVTLDELNELTEQVKQLINCFARPTTEISCAPVTKMPIDLTTDDIAKWWRYLILHFERVVTRGMRMQLEDAGIVRKRNSDIASPILLMTKENGEKCICVDFQDLSRITGKECYPLTLTDDQLNRQHNNKYFTGLDIAHGYYEAPLNKDSQPKIPRNTPDGLYEFIRTTFDLVNLPPVFQRIVNGILEPLRNTAVMTYTFTIFSGGCFELLRTFGGVCEKPFLRKSSHRQRGTRPWGLC